MSSFFGTNAFMPDDEFFQRMWDQYGAYRQRYTTGVTFTIRDETNYWRENACKVCWAKTGECGHTRTRTVHAERVGPLAITDGAARPDRILWTWPMLWERLSPLERQLAHGPRMVRNDIYPLCDTCPDEDWWPCPWAEDILQHFGLTKHDLDYRPGDERAAD